MDTRRVADTSIRVLNNPVLPYVSNFLDKIWVIIVLADVLRAKPESDFTSIGCCLYMVSSRLALKCW